METQQNPRRKYRKSGSNPANERFAQIYAVGDKEKGIKPNNATAAHREVFGAAKSPEAQRKLAHDKVTKVNDSIEYYRKQLETLQSEAHQAIADTLRQKKDKRLRFDAAKDVTDRNLGKPTQRTEHVGLTTMVVMDLTGQGSQPPPEIVAELEKTD